MSDRPYVSLCIPTNGVIHWVFPVLDSIYNQGISEDDFEVVVCDNGDNEEFATKMLAYADNHNNIIYQHTDAPVFLSEPESYKLAKGKLIKFINHRTKLKVGTLKYYIDYCKKYWDDTEKPILYFSNGVLNYKQICRYSDFDSFLCGLKIYSTWSTGMTIWNEDFAKISSKEAYNELFPHTTILFREKNRKEYIIDDTVLLEEIPQGKTAKGSYDVFYAFAVEFLGIILELLRNRDISYETYQTIKKEVKVFCADMYINYCLKKDYNSFDLSGFKNAIKVFFDERLFKVYVFYRWLVR